MPAENKRNQEIVVYSTVWCPDCKRAKKSSVNTVFHMSMIRSYLNELGDFPTFQLES